MVRRSRPKLTGGRIALYIRVSTAGQAEDGVSMDAQEERLQAYCALRGFTVAAVIKDPAQSAFKPLAKRKGGKELLDLVAAGAVDGVAIYKLDRGFRNVVDCLSTVADWDKRGVGLHIVDMGGATIDTSSAMGKMFLTMSAGFAELERNLTSERTTMALAHMASKGQEMGTAPFGYRYTDGQLAKEPTEQAVIALVWELRPDLSLRKICQRLADAGYTNRADGPFAPEQIQRMLAGPKRALVTA